MFKNRKQQITELYQTILLRDPDPAGSDAYEKSSLSIDEIKETLLRCDERKQLLLKQNILIEVPNHVANCGFRDIQFPFVIHPPENDLTISRHINQHGSWEPHISDIIVDALAPGGWFVDIGANIGWHTRVVQNAGHNVISFEPLAVNYELLRKNCLKDGSVLYNYALGDKHETQKIVWDTSNYGNSWIAEEGSEVIQVVRLDDIIDVSLVAKVDVVKMDVQGFETKVIEGGTKFFDTLHKGAVIVMEVSPTRSNVDMNLIVELVARATSSYAMCNWKSEPVSFNDAWQAIMFPEQYNIPSELFHPEFDLVIIK